MATNIKEVLIEKGFEYSPIEGLWKKSLGFGRKSTVAHVMKGLFTIEVDKEVVYDDYIDSFEQFKKIIEKI